MKSDEFIREVEEELRQDKMKQLWDQYGLIAIAAVVLVVGGTAGSVGWTAWQKNAAESVAQAYVEASEKIQPGEGNQDFAPLEAFADQADPGFATVARLRVASLSAASGESDRAIGSLEKVANDESADSLLRDFAKLSLATRDLEAGNTDQALSTLNAMIEANGPYTTIAQEIRVSAYLQQDDTQSAIDELIALRDLPDIDVQQRSRVDELLRALGHETEEATE